jgi:hypothetical protein
MILQEPLLVTLVKLVDCIPLPASAQKRGRGHPKVYSEHLIVKALVIMVIRRLYSAYSLLAFLKQDTPLTHQLRRLLQNSDGCFPSRRTWERRLKALPDNLPGLIGALGRHLVALIQPWAQLGRAAAVDSTMLRANGGVWHKQHREQGLVPHSSIDTEAHWSKSGYHGWWYGWKLHFACAVTSFWLPLAAELTVANTYDAKMAPALIRELPLEVRYVLGDHHYHDEEGKVLACCRLSDRFLITSQAGPYPHKGDGVQVRQIFHKLRSKAIEPFNGLFKNVFEWQGQVPVKGLRRVQLIVLGAVLVYQLVLLYQFQRGLPLGKGVKALLRAA